MGKIIKKTCQVCVLHTHRDYFDYVSDTVIVPGCRVLVPFRNSLRLGVVISNRESELAVEKLKPIDSLIDNSPLISEQSLKLCLWVSHYYQSPLSEVFPLAIPKLYRQGKAQTLPEKICYRVGKAASSLTQKQSALMELLSISPEGLSWKAIQAAGFSKAILNKLIEKNCVQSVSQIDWPVPLTNKVQTSLALNEAQQNAVETITSHCHQFHCFLLQGVTGSGKTEVYLQVMEKLLHQGKQVLYLVPEIGLTPQLLSRMRARVNVPIAVYHSHLNDSERQAAWQLTAENKVKLLIGTRTAVFAEMPDLALIIIDEEHDASFKQMEGVRYSARDTALVRAQMTGIPVILGSATPSLESLHNCELGKYLKLELKEKALNTIPLRFELCDLRKMPLKQGLAESSLQKIAQHLSKGQQVLVFINRRGFAPVLLCHQCGWMVDCPDCDAHLTYHRQAGVLHCHHCGKRAKPPNLCKSCKSTELLAIGAGTQRVHEYLQHCFPEETVLRIDRDEVSKKHALDQCLTKIETGEARLIVGTQMLAKGHHFPQLSLVIILDADAGFYNQDFRAIEKLGQLLVQVAGRAGRANLPGELLIQTHLPQHPLLNALFQSGYQGFAETLLDSRQKAALPPFTHLAMVRAQSSEAIKVEQFLKSLKNLLNNNQVSAYGPAPAPLARKANQHRMQLLLKSSSRAALGNSLQVLREWLDNPKHVRGIRWNIDVDPQDLA